MYSPGTEGTFLHWNEGFVKKPPCSLSVPLKMWQERQMQYIQQKTQHENSRKHRQSHKRNRNCQNIVGNSGHSIKFCKSQAAGWYTSLVFFTLCNHCSLNVFDTLYDELEVSRSGVKMQRQGLKYPFWGQADAFSFFCVLWLGIFELSYGFALNKTPGFAWKSCLMLGK